MCRGIPAFRSQIGVIFPKHLQRQILQALRQNHPYEEVAFEIYTLENEHQHIGMGMIGELNKAMPEKDFLAYLKERMQVSVVRHSALLSKDVKKVAVLGGSGAFAIENAKQPTSNTTNFSRLKGKFSLPI